MANQVVADIYAHNMETLASTLPLLVEVEDFAVQKVKKAAARHRIVQTPNSADFRAPFIYQLPGEAGIFSAAGGSLGNGSGYKASQFVQTTKAFKLGVGLNQDVINSTTGTKARRSAVKENTKQAMRNYRRMEDIMWHNITGTQGLIALATGYNTNVYTCDEEFGANLAQVGQPLEAFSFDLQTHRTTGSTPDSLPLVTAISKENRTITLDGADGSPAATDYLAFQGVGATPASHHGLYAFNNVATTGTLLGVNRATIPEINSNYVDGSSGLTIELGYQITSKIRQRRGSKPTLTGFAAPAQLLAIYQLGISISNWQRGQNDKMIDVMPQDADSLPFCGTDVFRDIHSSKKRIDWTSLKDWARVFSQEVGYYRDLNGNMFFEGRNGSGVVIATHLFYIWSKFNYVNIDPGMGGFVYDLPIPAGM